MSTVTQDLADLLDRPISVHDRERAALLLLDWTGCAVAGQKEAAGQKMTTAFETETGPCARIGASPGSALVAALHNGCLGNILEMDDVDRQAILHAGPSIMPAVLAVAEQVQADANDMLDAIVVGYEATIRIGRAVGPGHYALWHNTATCGPFGAAAAACHLLPDSDPVSAMGLAGTQAAGLWQTRHEPDSMAKHLHCSHAAHAGLLSALLSVQGFQGPRSILDGEQGFFKALCPGADPYAVLNDPSAAWYIHDMSLKPYPACRHAHPAIDAALALREKVDVGSLDTLSLETYSDALKFCDRPEPTTVIEAKFSLQHSVAVTLLRGVPHLSDFEPGVIHEPEIAALRARVSVHLSPEIDALYPAHFGARLLDGSVSAHVQDAYGDPEHPMSEAAVMDKARLLMVHGGMTNKCAEALCDAALALAQGGPVQAYIDALP